MLSDRKTISLAKPAHSTLAGSLPCWLAENLLFLLTIIVGVAVFFGIGFCTGGVAKAILTVPVPFLAVGFGIEAAVWYLTWMLFYKKRELSDRHFALFVASAWVISRGLIILAFPHATITGDETFLHRFVVSLADGGLGHANLSALSSWYDYPIWLSRAFPFYLPLRLLFGSADLIAIRILNAALGAGTVVLAYLVASFLLGQAYGRLTAWILLIWPYHVADVLSYDPQIPGTFFFLFGVWLALELVYSRELVLSWSTAVRAVLLGLDLWLAEVQRGGIDALLFVSIIVSACFYSFFRTGRLPAKAFAALMLLTFVSWMPPRVVFERWIAANDTQHLRSHLLGFMTRGWNLVSLGEYLPRYEQLDISSPPGEKNRILEAVLLTEVVRSPFDTLAVVPATKMAKFLALGYSASAETDLENGGYPRAAMALTGLRVSSALLLLGFCLLGLIKVLRESWLRTRLVLPLMLTSLSILAITLIWETMSRYSHPLHFALAMLAAVGFLSFRKRFLLRPGKALLAKKVTASLALIAGAWILTWSAAFAAGSMAKSYRFADLKNLRANVDEAFVPVLQLNKRTAAWEETIEIPAGTGLPANLRLLLPASAVPVKSNQFSFSVWIPEDDKDECPFCRIEVTSPGKGSSDISFKNLIHMTRVTLTVASSNNNSRVLQLRILSPRGQTTQLSARLRLAVGYFLPE